MCTRPARSRGTRLRRPRASQCLSQLTPDAYERLVGRATILANGLRDAFAAAGVDAYVPRLGSLVGLFFGSHAPVDYDEAKVSVAAGGYPVFFHAMLDQGIALAPVPTR